MKKLLFILLFPSILFAQSDDVGTCGVGSKLFENNRGLAPKVLAVTTNGSSFNTIAMSSGTSGCSQDGVVRSSWKTVYFIDQNMNRLARDISRGEGETLASFSQMVGVSQADQVAFNTELKNNFGNIFASDKVDSGSVHQAIKTVLASNQTLAAYSNNL